MFEKKKSESEIWREQEILRCQKIMDASDPASAEYKAAQEARMKYLTERNTPVKGIDQDVKKEGIHVIGGLIMFAGSALLEAKGFMVPTRWFSATTLFKRGK